MKLATRTGLAALVASAIAILVLANVVATRFERVLSDRVDETLTERAASSAAVLVAVGDRISVSELNGVIASARVATGMGTDAMQTIEVGQQPSGGLPRVGEPGLRTVKVGDESWRLYAVSVDDVPELGDRAVVEFAEPLGSVQQRIRDSRRRVIIGGFVAAIGAGVIGWLFGRRAARPLTRLQHDAAALGGAERLAVADRYGTPEVDDVAAALNAGLSDLSEAIERREQALAAARDFAASATHELRTPLQSAMTNLDVALAAEAGQAGQAGSPDAGSVAVARSELARMAVSLTTVQALSQADLAQPQWFEQMDVDALADLADEVTSRSSSTSRIELVVEQPLSVANFAVWPDGVRLALDNVLRNALTHGRPVDGSPGHVEVRIVVDETTGAPTIVVDDDGPGIAADDRVRVIAPFERGSTATPGSGLGLAVVDRVARAHSGSVTVGSSPLGGTRIEIALGPLTLDPRLRSNAMRSGP
ncbi:MAG TPA: HAMP domain-containing sensor histidine kinase [Ilumatobacteraceae bacterium]|nr:HAMP domain-containing sensor histidine kinase [Ilumatobacteraceae bacterium]